MQTAGISPSDRWVDRPTKKPRVAAASAGEQEGPSVEPSVDPGEEAAAAQSSPDRGNAGCCDRRGSHIPLHERRRMDPPVSPPSSTMGETLEVKRAPDGNCHPLKDSLLLFHLLGRLLTSLKRKMTFFLRMMTIIIIIIIIIIIYAIWWTLTRP